MGWKRDKHVISPKSQTTQPYNSQHTLYHNSFTEVHPERNIFLRNHLITVNFMPLQRHQIMNWCDT